MLMMNNDFSSTNLAYYTAAILLYAHLWKNEEVPKLEMLIEKIYEVVEMDMLSERIKEGNLGEN